MKMFIITLLLFITAPVAHAEYSDLTTLKKYGRKEIQGYAERLSDVEPKFEGVVKFGKALQQVKDNADFEVNKITVANKNYWRAVIEMAPTDTSILFAHANLYVMRGEIAYAEAYFLLGSMTMASDFRPKLTKFQELKTNLDNQVERDIQRGVQHHDKGEYTKALAVYDDVISQYPNSAWALYEKAFSYMMMPTDATPSEKNKKKEKMYAECRLRDPFYWMAYQGSDQKVIMKLKVLTNKVMPLLSKEQWNVKGLERFAEGCEELELFSFAAHARWKLVQLDPANKEIHLEKFIDLVSKCGVDLDFFRRNDKKISNQAQQR